MGYNSFLSRFIAMFTLSQIWPLGSFHTGSCVFSPVSFILRALPYLPTQPDAPGWSYTSYSFHTLAQVPLSGLKSKPNRNYSPTLKSEVQTTYAVLSPTLFKGVSGLKSKWWRTFFFFFAESELWVLWVPHLMGEAGDGHHFTSSLIRGFSRRIPGECAVFPLGPG